MIRWPDTPSQLSCSQTFYPFVILESKEVWTPWLPIPFNYLFVCQSKFIKNTFCVLSTIVTAWICRISVWFHLYMFKQPVFVSFYRSKFVNRFSYTRPPTIYWKISFSYRICSALFTVWNLWTGLDTCPLTIYWKSVFSYHICSALFAVWNLWTGLSHTCPPSIYWINFFVPYRICSTFIAVCILCTSLI